MLLRLIANELDALDGKGYPGKNRRANTALANSAVAKSRSEWSLGNLEADRSAGAFTTRNHFTGNRIVE